MKVLSCFTYCLFTIGYAWYPYEANKYLYLFNMCNLLGFIAILCYFVNSIIPSTETEKLFFQYAMWLSICRALYTCYCVFMDKAWIVHHTDVFNVLTAISFAVLLFHCLLKRS